MGFGDTLIEQAKQLNQRVVFPETEDERTLRAAEILAREKIVQVQLVGATGAVKADAAKLGVDLSGCEIFDPADDTLALPLAEKMLELRKAKGMTEAQAKDLIRNKLYFATMLLKDGQSDGYVGGACHSTGDNLRPGLQLIKAAPGIQTISSFFLMIHPDPRWGHQGVMLYADCGMVEQPSAEQLSDIAIASAKSFKQLVRAEPVIAMLSYSTKGSASSSDTEKVIKAMELAKKALPEVALDGEMQFDAALIPSVGQRKCPGSPVAGKANCFIFPDLDAGNLGYKITERLGGAQAIGPLVQGMAKPAHDLSRGCSVDDIVKVAAVAAIMAN
jgi:phosphate acetyltransferase